jgi:anti-sigma factor ChrR (cupin superfamily)
MGTSTSGFAQGCRGRSALGDPGKTGPFTIRLKVPAGYKIPAHNHPTYEAVTVISGNFNIGMGDKLDEAKAEKLSAVSSISQQI